MMIGNKKCLFPCDEEVDIQSLIIKASNVATLIYCGGIWVANGKFGVTWRLFQAVVKPKQSLSGSRSSTRTKVARTAMKEEESLASERMTNQRRKGPFLICEGDHFARDCPQKKAGDHSLIYEHGEEEAEEPEPAD